MGGLGDTWLSWGKRVTGSKLSDFKDSRLFDFVLSTSWLHFKMWDLSVIFQPPCLWLPHHDRFLSLFNFEANKGFFLYATLPMVFYHSKLKVTNMYLEISHTYRKVLLLHLLFDVFCMTDDRHAWWTMVVFDKYWVRIICKSSPKRTN